MADIKIGIVGATGYTGSELVRILRNHPDASLEVVTSRSYSGMKFSEIHPQFVDIFDKKLDDVNKLDQYKLDLVFLALPHGKSMEFVKEKGVKSYKIIDLSGDFRIKSTTLYNQWYKTKHVCPKMIKQAVFGLPELFRNEIRRARLIANPGCYPTSAILALAPLIRNDLIKHKEIVIDSKSGVTGAGSKAKDNTHFPSVVGNFNAYALHHHRHTPEIESVLKQYSGTNIQALFTPHLLPVDRGILTTIYAKPKKKIDCEELKNIFHTFYKKESFVRFLDSPPSIKNVRGSNYCDIYVSYDSRTNTIITVSAIDNLVKGASGQAVQNMNILFNLLENSGLKNLPLSP
jgi:N-acetyl-gamma-glutamyl-phosphate reductase